MKKILTTGGEGFIGSHIVEEFVKNGYDVVSFSEKISNNLNELSNDILSHVDRLTGDIRDLETLINVSKDCEGIIHLAALKAVQDSFDAKETYNQINIGGTNNILEAALINKVKKIIITSSTEVYGQPKDLLVKEDHQLDGLSPYALTKIENEKQAQKYREKGLNVVIIRPSNVFGPRQSTQAVIPTIITQMVRGDKQLKLGSLSPTIDFNYVSDIAKAFYMAYVSDKTDNETFNLATGVATSIKEIADYVIEKVNPGAEIVCDESKLRLISDANKRVSIDASKIKHATGWNNDHSIYEGLDLTINYYKNKENM